MKTKLTLLTIIMALGFTVLLSQQRMSHEERMEILNEKLNLSEKQFTQIDTILKDQTKEFQKLREEADGDWEQMREKFMELRKETDDRIVEVLNAEQQKEYEKYKKERRQSRRERGSRN